MTTNRKLNVLLAWGIPVSLVILKILGVARFDCLIYKYTGLSCPGCGTTRMILELLDGNVYQAFMFNPYLFITSIIPLIYLIEKSIKYIKNGELRSKSDIFIIVYIISLIIYGIIRNLDTFSWLLPTVVK